MLFRSIFTKSGNTVAFFKQKINRFPHLHRNQKFLIMRLGTLHNFYNLKSSMVLSSFKIIFTILFELQNTSIRNSNNAITSMCHLVIMRYYNNCFTSSVNFCNLIHNLNAVFTVKSPCRFITQQ